MENKKECAEVANSSWQKDMNKRQTINILIIVG